MSKTLFDKVWDSHVVRSIDNGPDVLFIARHLVHEVTSPQAFEGLRLAGRTPWRTGSVLAVPDHNVPTTPRAGGVAACERVRLSSRSSRSVNSPICFCSPEISAARFC